MSSPRSRFQRNYPSRRGRFSALGPSALGPSASVASASAFSHYQAAPETCGEARFSQYQQAHTSSRSYTPIDLVPPEPPPRVQSLLPVDHGPSTEAPQTDFFTTKAPAARHDCREGSPFERYSRRDSYQQPQQAGRDWAFGLQRPIMPTVSVYLAASPSADRPSADRPREPLDDEIEQLRSQLERAKALKASTIAPQQQVAPARRFIQPSTSYGSFHDKYVAPYSHSSLDSSAYAPGVPAVASAARYTFADVRPFEHASHGAARITERPRESRPSVAATSALPPLA